MLWFKAKPPRPVVLKTALVIVAKLGAVMTVGLERTLVRCGGGHFCIRCSISTKAVESQTVAAFSSGLRAESSFRAHSSSGNLSALLLG